MLVERGERGSLGLVEGRIETNRKGRWATLAVVAVVPAYPPGTGPKRGLCNTRQALAQPPDRHSRVPGWSTEPWRF